MRTWIRRFALLALVVIGALSGSWPGVEADLRTTREEACACGCEAPTPSSPTSKGSCPSRSDACRTTLGLAREARPVAFLRFVEARCERTEPEPWPSELTQRWVPIESEPGPGEGFLRRGDPPPTITRLAKLAVFRI